MVGADLLPVREFLDLIVGGFVAFLLALFPPTDATPITRLRPAVASL